jgi:hypothetical protein
MRRTFFRSSEKNTRKRKEQQIRQQQVEHGHVDKLRASSSTTGSDPPPNLNGPTRTAPKKSSTGGQHYTSRDLNSDKLSEVQENNYGDPPQYQDNYLQSSEYQIQQHYLQENQTGYDQLQQNFVHHDMPQKQHHQDPSTQYGVPTVESATDQMWQCETGDFRSGSLAIQVSLVGNVLVLCNLASCSFNILV